MSNIEVTLNKDGIKKLLQSKEMLQEVEKVAQKKCSSGSHIKSFVGFDRAKAIIYPNTQRNNK